MKKLELKHLAAYLPYKLNCNLYDNGELINNGELMTIKTKYSENSENLLTFNCKSKKYPEKYTHPLCFNYVEIKPILRPLSDLFKEIETNEKFIPVLELKQIADTDYERDFIENLEQIVKENKIEYMPYTLLSYLFEWHFDIFGLIEKGLAVDFNKA